MKQALIFDLYGTLIDIRTDETEAQMYERLSEWLKQRGTVISPEALKEMYFTLVKQEEKKIPLYGEIELMQVFQKIYEEDAQTFAKVFRVYSRKKLRLFPHTKEVLQSLREKGYVLYLLSNAQTCFTLDELKEMGLDAFFEDILISSQYGVKKPGASFMKALLEKEKLEVHECIMIGNDFHTDIQIADTFGMSSVFLNTDGYTTTEMNRMKQELKHPEKVILKQTIQELGEYLCQNG